MTGSFVSVLMNQIINDLSQVKANEVSYGSFTTNIHNISSILRIASQLTNIMLSFKDELKK